MAGQLQGPRPLYVITGQPTGWNRGSIPKLQAIFTSAAPTGPADLHTRLLAEQAQRWEAATGVRPEDTHLTIIMPIRNEEKSLPSALGALLLSDLPTAADVVVVFVTNACSDNSAALVMCYLEALGKVELRHFAGRSGDPHLKRQHAAVQVDNMTFLHFDTPTPGKANALTIGNAVALQRGHVVAISVDANNYLEPDAIRIMFGEARAAFTQVPGGIVLLSVGETKDWKASSTTTFFKYAGTIPTGITDNEGIVNGWCMAWDIAWVERIGGVPAVAAEDYALGVKARLGGYGHRRVPAARTWGYAPSGLRDALSARARLVRGQLQLLAQDPSTRPIMDGDTHYLRPFLGRIRTLGDWLRDYLRAVPALLAHFALWEVALLLGRQAHRRDPHNQSWAAVRSTL